MWTEIARLDVPAGGLLLRFLQIQLLTKTSVFKTRLADLHSAVFSLNPAALTMHLISLKVFLLTKNSFTIFDDFSLGASPSPCNPVSRRDPTL